jgi:hypothetical protein
VRALADRIGSNEAQSGERAWPSPNSRGQEAAEDKVLRLESQIKARADSQDSVLKKAMKDASDVQKSLEDQISRKDAELEDLKSKLRTATLDAARQRDMETRRLQHLSEVFLNMHFLTLAVASGDYQEPNSQSENGGVRRRCVVIYTK